MHYSYLKKSLTLAIIILTIGLSFSQNINVISNERELIKLNNKDILLADLLIDQFISFYMKLGHIPSLVVGIIKKDELVWGKGYGFYDIRQNKMANIETIYAVASISKTVTATALMQLYDKGLFKLDDDINDYLNFSIRNPNYPESNITFRMLLSHQSSLSSDNDIWHLHKDYPGDCPLSFYQFLKEYLSPGGSEYRPEVWADSYPGEDFHYSGIGYAIIGLLIEQLTGETFDDYCMNNIFIPLEMFDSSFRYIDIDKDNLAIPYIYTFWGYEPYMHAGDIDYPSGCLRSSIVDLSHFLIAHMNNGQYKNKIILKESTVEEMHSPQLSNKVYGLGWEIWKNKKGEKMIGHTGGNIGVSTKMKYYVSNDFSIIYFINRKCTLVIENIAQNLIENLLLIKARLY